MYKTVQTPSIFLSFRQSYKKKFFSWFGWTATPTMTSSFLTPWSLPYNMTQNLNLPKFVCMNDNDLIFYSNFILTGYVSKLKFLKFDDVITFYKNIVRLKITTWMMTSSLEMFFLGCKSIFCEKYTPFQNGIKHCIMILDFTHNFFIFWPKMLTAAKILVTIVFGNC